MLKDIKAILKAFDESGSVYLSYTNGDIRIELKKPCTEETGASTPLVVPYMPSYPVVGHPAEGHMPGRIHATLSAEPNSGSAVKAPVNPPVNDRQTEVKSPIVGVFYAAKEPGAQPFVKQGDRVEKGQVLCILESMKMLNEIKAPISGTVVKVDVTNETLVEYGQVLFVLEA